MDEQTAAKHGIHKDPEGNVRIGLKYLMMHPEEFGYAIIVPDIRKDAPCMPVRAYSTDLRDPTSRYALIKRDRDQSLGEHDGEVVRNDLLIHIPTGTIAVCVERQSRWNFRIESLVPPQTEKDMRVFLGTTPHLTGEWVVVGSAWTAEEMRAAKLRLGLGGGPPQILTDPKEMREAQLDTMSNPDAKSWGQQGKKFLKDPKKIRNQRARAKYAELLLHVGGTTTPEELAKDATAILDTKDGKGQIIVWNTANRMMRKIRRGEDE
jgi:hypothetical protein